MRNFTLAIIVVLGSTFFAPQTSAQTLCSKRLAAFLCYACRPGDAGLVDAYRKSNGGIGGACERCTKKCGESIPESVSKQLVQTSNEDALLASPAADGGGQVCDVIPDGLILRNAVLERNQFIEIAKINTAVAAAVYQKMEQGAEMNFAGLDGGISGFSMRYSLEELTKVWDDPRQEIGTLYEDGTGMVVESNQIKSEGDRVTFEFISYRVSAEGNVRVVEYPIVHLEFALPPVREHKIPDAVDGVQQTLKLLGIKTLLSRDLTAADPM